MYILPARERRKAAVLNFPFFLPTAGSYFTLSMFDRMWHPDLTEPEALDMMEKGIEEVKKRLVVAPAHYIIKVVDKDGIRTVKVV